MAFGGRFGKVCLLDGYVRTASGQTLWKFTVRIYSYGIIRDDHRLRYLDKVLREALLQFSGLENDAWQRHLKRHRSVARIQCALIALDDWMGPPARTSGAEKG